MFETIRDAVEHHRAAAAASAELHRQLRDHRDVMRQVIDHLRTHGHADLERAVTTEWATIAHPETHAQYRRRTDELLREIEEKTGRPTGTHHPSS